MDFVSLALYSEGSTDDRFLPLIIVRTAQRILKQYQKHNLQILPVKPIYARKQRDRSRSLLEAARIASEHQILIAHSDSDARGLDQTRQQLFLPGSELVQQQQHGVCKCLVPLIPIQAVESWMLADYRLLLEEIGTRKKAGDLHIPEKAHLVETIARLKERLEEAIRLAFKDQPNRLRRMSTREIRLSLYEPMGRNIDLDRLELLDGYQAFKQELIMAFSLLDILSQVFER